jgi:hypothetical protein
MARGDCKTATPAMVTDPGQFTFMFEGWGDGEEYIRPLTSPVLYVMSGAGCVLRGRHRRNVI